MSELNINVEGGSSTKLLTAGKYCPDDIIITASGGSGAEVEPIVLTGEQIYGCAGDISTAYINMYGETISTKDINNSQYMFYKNKCKKIPFEINMKNDTYKTMRQMFESSKIEEMPIINNGYPNELMEFCMLSTNLRYIPENCFDSWNFDRIHNYSNGNNSFIFSSCYSLRKIPETFLKNVYSNATSASRVQYYNYFSNCASLDEINKLAVHPIELTTNVFRQTFDYCYRLKDITFNTNEDGSPQIAAWKGQIIDLTLSVGYVAVAAYILNYSSGLTLDNRVLTEGSYNLLKNTPDWWAADMEYSRYNHDSAVHTINSLPDTSTYIAANGGTNTIKFKGAAGSATDGGAINTLTDAEIAVAAAKGWTVTLV